MWLRVGLLGVGLFALPCAAQFTEQLTVVGSRLPSAPLRRVWVWQAEELDKLPLRHWSDLLRLVAGAGLARRGVFGIQADAALTGAPFEGLLVLVNGVPVNDPQTGHFHLDVPFPAGAIERVEVLAGAATTLFGSNAVGGVVAITTKQAAHWQGHLAMGSDSLSAASLAGPLGSHWGFFAERAEAAGFRADADFHLGRATLVGRGTLAGFRLSTVLSAGQQQFGAWTFYSSRFPHQRERTTVALATLRAERALGPGRSLEVLVGGRQHRDVYILDKTRPSWYRNRHRTRQAYAGMVLRGGGKDLSWALGVDGERQLLASSRLGNHARHRLGLFGELARSWDRWSVHLQGRQDWHPGQGRFSPGVNLTYGSASGWRWGLGLAAAFRLPSFTELYYQSPASVGNPKLQPEQSWTAEATVELPLAHGTWRLALFRRRARDLVDWVRSDTGIYHARNHARATTVGASADSQWTLSHGRLALSLAYLESRIAVDATRSAYALTHPRWEGSLFGDAAWGRLELAGSLTYRKPQGRGGFPLLELSWRWPRGSPLSLEVSVFNLFNRRYQEVPGVPQPGRLWLAALTWKP